ncbi:hypothetical protein BC936DRAFT_140288 [Jimgerdemannia flammicorona]|uniref:Uncharacterized protein n=1 Tax=Jimgerdemannia flammicorona TaxID=994334 RepID=A0A433AVM2_9FUNG|nr:hypothetical protein BC936DRAFT_140288 [Jimgerdemannia flammicorona]
MQRVLGTLLYTSNRELGQFRMLRWIRGRRCHDRERQENKTRGVYVEGLVEVYVSSVNEIHEAMRRGTGARIVAYTTNTNRTNAIRRFGGLQEGQQDQRVQADSRGGQDQKVADRIRHGHIALTDGTERAFKALIMTDDSRPATPTIFLERANQISENKLANRDAQVNQMKEELGYYKEQDGQLTKDDQRIERAQASAAEGLADGLFVLLLNEDAGGEVFGVVQLRQCCLSFRFERKREDLEGKLTTLSSSMRNCWVSVLGGHARSVKVGCAARGMVGEPTLKAKASFMDLTALTDLKKVNEQLQVTLARRLRRDLQNRYEKVIEVEVEVEIRRDAGAAQQKMASLERNLEQLTNGYVVKILLISPSSELVAQERGRHRGAKAHCGKTSVSRAWRHRTIDVGNQVFTVARR